MNFNIDKVKIKIKCNKGEKDKFCEVYIKREQKLSRE